MIKNYLKVAIRNLVKYKVFSFINVLGLATGVAVCLLVMLYVSDELSWDRHFSDSENIYRVGLHGRLGKQELIDPITPPPMAAALIAEIPGVVSATRLQNPGFPVLRYEEKVFSEEGFAWADSNFFNVFQLQLLRGDPKTVLRHPNHLVITESVAKRYFGDDDPIGKVLNADRRADYTVAGVLADIPRNTHFSSMNIFLSTSGRQGRGEDMWVNNNVMTYVRVQDGITKADLEAQMPQLVEKYVAPQVERFMGMDFQQFLNNGGLWSYYIEPVTDIHLKAQGSMKIEPGGDYTWLVLFSVVGVFLLMIAIINFINMSTARSLYRAREVGLRKTIGASRGQLITQFLTESVLTAIMAVIVGVLMAQLALPAFREFTGKPLQIPYLTAGWFMPELLLAAIIIGILAGIYPALVMANFDPVKVLKGSFHRSRSSIVLRKALVIFQFSVSIVLLIGTLVVRGQLSYVMHKELGFNKNGILVVEKTDDLQTQASTFKEQIRQLPGVVGVTGNQNIMAVQQHENITPYNVQGEDANQQNLVWQKIVDHDFADVYQLKMKAGRWFSRDFPTDSGAIILNEAAVRSFGLDDPTTAILTHPRGPNQEPQQLPVIGVVKDFHFETLHEPIKPLVFVMWDGPYIGRYQSIRYNTNNFPALLASVTTKWKEFSNNQAFEHFNYDESFDNLYQADIQTRTLFSVFALLAVFVASLGLYGLAAFNAVQRTREIGIRKALGASSGNIVVLLGKEIMNLVITSALVATPIAWYLMREWLAGFAYRIQLSPTPFLYSAFAAIMIALLTVSYQSMKAAMGDPVRALKYE